MVNITKTVGRIKKSSFKRVLENMANRTDFS